MTGSSLMHHQIIAHCTISYVAGTRAGALLCSFTIIFVPLILASAGNMTHCLMLGSSLMQHHVIDHYTIRFVTSTPCQCNVVIFYHHFCSAIFSQCRKPKALFWCQYQLSCTIKLLSIARSGMSQKARARALLWSFAIIFVQLFLASAGNLPHCFDAKVKYDAPSDYRPLRDQ